MKKRYSLLDIDSTQAVGMVDDEEIRFLDLKHLFCESAVSQLAVIPDLKTAHARREIMKAIILCENSYKVFFALKEAVTDYSRSCTILDDSKSEFERAFAYIESVKSFYKVIESINGLFDAKLTVALKESVDAFSSRSEFIYESVQRIELKLKKIVSLTLRHSNAISSDPEGDFCLLIKNVCSALGYDVSSDNKRIVRVTSEFSDTVINSFPELFHEIYLFQNETTDAVDRDILMIRGDLDFYLSIADVFHSAREKALPFCFPEESHVPKYQAESIIDPYLINRVENIVSNNALFDGYSPIAYVMGANGGGKTSILRALASNLLLFLGGCPVFALKAEIYPFRFVRLFYPKEEHSFDTGRFDEEKKRINRFVDEADDHTFAFFNEVFSGTTEPRAEIELCELTHKLKSKGAFALFVTHFLNAETDLVTKLAVKVTADGERTFKVVPADEAISSYANDVLKKYRLDPESIGEERADDD